MNIKIISDTGCDLSQDIINEYGIEMLPIIVIRDDKEYLDKVTIDPTEVYNGMRNGEVFKTAQIAPTTFMECFENVAKKEESAIYIAFSSGLSGTYNTSMSVRELIKEEYSNLDLDIVDTKAASGGFGLIVLKAAQMAKEGKSKEEILAAIDFYKEHMEYIFTVDDIEYLFRGGRVSKTQAFVGGLLNIKPILNVEDGSLVPIDKARGRIKAFRIMLDIIEKRSKNVDLKNQMFSITHGDDLEGAMKIKELIIERFGLEKFQINIIGAAIGAHSGPGTIALFFINKEYDR